jgi:LPXTG-motif cell wall-anchored protein
LTFQGLDYGYYAVTSTQGATVTIDSIKPNATVNDKNTKTIVVVKTVEKESYTIGDTINYTATFNTINFYGSGADAKQVIKYTITDTLPPFLSNAAIDTITVTKKDGTTTDATITGKSFTNGSFDIDWADEVTPSTDPKTYKSKYDNGAKIIVTYHATLTSVTNINTADTNTIKIQPTVVKPDGTEEQPWDESWQDDAVIKTYGTALKKVDGTTKEALKGAKFQVPGLTVEAVTGEPGVYKVVSYNATSTTAGTEMSTNNDGKLYILGLASTVTLSATETAAPEGYNKADAAISLPAQGTLTTEIIETAGTRYYDAKGNLIREEVTGGSKKEDLTANYASILDPVAVEVVNNKGAELPSTGGIGTTIFYVAGIVLVLGAAAIIIARRKAEQ